MDKKDTGYRGLELLQANAARYYSCISSSFPGKKKSQYLSRVVHDAYLSVAKSSGATYILTSQDFSWLQNGQVNWVSRLPVIFFLGGGFLFDFLRPICNAEYLQKKQTTTKRRLNNTLSDRCGRDQTLGHLTAFETLSNRDAHVPMCMYLCVCCEIIVICIYPSIYFTVGRYCHFSWLCSHTSTAEHYNLFYENTTNHQPYVNQLMYQ